jgi:hypothetical protein
VGRNAPAHVCATRTTTGKIHPLLLPLSLSPSLPLSLSPSLLPAPPFLPGAPSVRSAMAWAKARTSWCQGTFSSILHMEGAA